ncbi:YesL family protein [Alkalihalobacillus sp. TS-13]|uniref:YesL family protein n=1 Tax=Alkalihalobacillus sp. TS-13 TaxID=2842455 RepID=UPI001C878097|nr:DUF624 domain-containing protein [Alkalihalobacillus sp. TS-13]
MGGWEKFNKVAYWMLKAAYINLLWILFTCLGLVVFGLFPSTIAMFTVVQKWFKKKDIRIFQTYWRMFRKEFIKGNGFGLIFLSLGYFLYYDFLLLQANHGSLQYLYPILVFILFVYILTLLFFFTVYVHFQLSFFQYLKQAFLIAVVSPLETLLILAAIILMYIMITILPGIIPLFPGSILAFVTTWLSRRAFQKIKNKQVKQSTK